MPEMPPTKNVSKKNGTALPKWRASRTTSRESRRRSHSAAAEEEGAEATEGVGEEGDWMVMILIPMLMI